MTCSSRWTFPRAQLNSSSMIFAARSYENPSEGIGMKRLPPASGLSSASTCAFAKSRTSIHECTFSNNFSSVLHPEAWEKVVYVKTVKGY